MSAGVFSALFPATAGALERAFLRTSDGRVLRYGEARAQSARLAHALVACGVRPGDRVAVQVEKSPEAVLLYLATLRAGAVYLPLNTAYTAAELEYFLADAEPALFVCAPEREGGLEPLARRAGVRAVLTLGPAGSGSLIARSASCPDHFETVARQDGDLAAILYTSGTTGRSKGAMLTQSNLVSNARTLAALWEFTAQDVLLHALPIFHIHGLFVAINVTLAAGSSILLLPRFDAGQVLRHLPDASVMMGVPTYYVRLLREPGLARALLAHCRLFISGSAPLLIETHREWTDRTGHTLLERYGMSETGMNTSNPCTGERVPESVGPPLPGVAVRITDAASGAPLPPGEVGMIEVRGPNVFAGYWRRPEREREDFHDGFFITGDLGRLDARGYLFIVGRAKDLVISGGYNVYPKEIEAEIDALAGVLESAVIGVPHPDFGEAVTAVIVPVAAARPADEQVLAALRLRLAAYKLPKRLIFVDELPRNSMGKVQKKLLRERYAGLFRP
ncbi:MAG TPA: malonyl-CoA synthase [Steroidobacteraceae bacterium]